MTLNDLIADPEKKSMSLEGVKMRTADGKVGYWKSQWQKGVWMTDGESNRIYPQFVESLTECLEWEIVGDDVKVNL